MVDRTGQVWVIEQHNIILLVLGAPTRAVVAESRTVFAPVLMMHPCLNLLTGAKFNATERLDEPWEGWQDGRLA